MFLLDRDASRKANQDNGNLVLNYQGPGPIARKILNIEEKKPRIALAVVHEVLSFQDDHEDLLTMVGAGKAVQQRQVRDARHHPEKVERSAPPQPTVLTFVSSRFENLEFERTESEKDIAEIKQEIAELAATEAVRVASR